MDIDSSSVGFKTSEPSFPFPQFLILNNAPGTSLSSNETKFHYKRTILHLRSLLYRDFSPSLICPHYHDWRGE